MRMIVKSMRQFRSRIWTWVRCFRNAPTINFLYWVVGALYTDVVWVYDHNGNETTTDWSQFMRLIDWRGFNQNKSPGETLSVVCRWQASKGRLYWAWPCRSCFLAYTTSAFSCSKMSCLTVFVMPNIYSVFYFVPCIIVGVPSVFATISCFEIVFVSPKKLAMVMRKDTLRMTFTISRAAPHFIRFPVSVLGVSSINLARLVCTVIMAYLNGGVRTRCEDRTLRERRPLGF